MRPKNVAIPSELNYGLQTAWLIAVLLSEQVFRLDSQAERTPSPQSPTNKNRETRRRKARVLSDRAVDRTNE